MTGGTVWITSTYPWEREPVGGIFFRTQARSLRRLGMPVTVVCPIPWAPWPLPLLRPRWRIYAETPRSADDSGIAVVRPRYPNVPGRPSIAQPDRAIASAVWRARCAWAGAGVVHGHYSIQGLAAWRIARRVGLPLVLTFHGDDMNTWPDEHPERLSELRTAVREAGVVIGVSGAMVDRIRQVTGVEAVHLPIGIDQAAIASRRLPRAEARTHLALRQDRVVVLYVGALLREKGVRELVDAVLGLGDRFHGVLVGDGPEAGYGTADARAVGRLEYRGRVTNEEVAAYLSAADVLVLPSYGEGLPTILVEAGSLEVPVIASAVGGIPALLGDGRGRVLDEVSAAAVARALTAFVDDRSGAAAAAARLRPYLLEHYDAERNARRLIDLYRSVAPDLGDPSAAPSVVVDPR